uniref:Uncharacterized protein n=1 Tax=Romanomermis culicivorax TaxID=13658 RepID=A0A915L1D1_ROMCU
MCYPLLMCVGHPDIRTDILKNGYPDVKKYPVIWIYPNIFIVQERRAMASNLPKSPGWCQINPHSSHGYTDISYGKKLSRPARESMITDICWRL